MMPTDVEVSRGVCLEVIGAKPTKASVLAKDSTDKTPFKALLELYLKMPYICSLAYHDQNVQEGSITLQTLTCDQMSSEEAA